MIRSESLYGYFRWHMCHLRAGNYEDDTGKKTIHVPKGNEGEGANENNNNKNDSNESNYGFW